MKISKETFAILRNFAAINQSLRFMPGNVIMTAVGGQAKDFYAVATVPETFPVDCAIYDLKRFRECASLFTDPEFNFMEKYVEITDGKGNFNYVYCNPEILDAPDYKKKISVKTPLATFELKYSQIKQANDAASILDCPDVLIRSDGGEITMTALDESNDSADTFRIVIAEGVECPDFVSKYSIEKLRKLIDADYIVTIAEKIITEFRSQNVTYYTGGEIKITGKE